MDVSRITQLLALGLLSVCALGSAVPATAVCPSGGTSALPPPAVDSLRGYRAALRSPTRLAVDGLGRVYAADPATGTVIVRAADGRLLAAGEGLGRPVSLAVAAGGEPIYVGDAAAGRVTAYSAAWVPLFDLGQGDGELALPGDIAVDPATGNVWVTDSFDHRVEVYGTTGAWLFGFGGRGDGEGQFNFPTGIHVDAGAGEVLVADQVNARVQFFDSSGTFKACIGVPEENGTGLFNMPQGIWTDDLGRIYVSDAFESWVRVVDRQGAIVATLGDVGTGPGRLSTPSDLVIDPSGRLFVASTTAGRLEIFGLDGYSDPERFVPAAVVLDAGTGATVRATIEVPGYRLGLVEAGTVAANGVPALAGSAVIGDADGDHRADLSVTFDRAALAATLPPGGEGAVRVSGQIAGLELEGFDHLSLSSDPGGDGDGDGFPDGADRCPGTAAGSAVDDQGCSLDQLCPCSGPEAGRAWENHGRYVSCVVRRVRGISHPPLDQRTRQRLVKDAARSSCGK